MIYTNDHESPHVHVFHSGDKLVIDLVTLHPRIQPTMKLALAKLAKKLVAQNRQLPWENGTIFMEVKMIEYTTMTEKEYNDAVAQCKKEDSTHPRAVAFSYDLGTREAHLELRNHPSINPDQPTSWF